MTLERFGRRAADLLDGLAPATRRVPCIGTDEHATRIAQARRALRVHGYDAVLVNAGASLRYFAGVPWAPTERLVALLLPADGRPMLIAPAFELGSLAAVLKIDADILAWEEHESPCRMLADALHRQGIARLAVDPLLPFAVTEALQKCSQSLRMSTGDVVIDACRMRKSPAELALIGEAMAITLEVHRLTASILEPGIAASTVKRFIDTAHRALGADGGSTFCAVQFGEATAYPHGLPGDQRLQRDDLVLIDTGCLVDGYNADITRTYAFGTPQAAHREVWEHEREAQQAAFDAVRPGEPCEAIDAVARRSLARAGYGPDYRLPGLPHRTGHGIGLSIHEPAYLVRGDVTPLAPGMCFSDEPMIVIPERFGIRLEDHFHVTESGACWFTPPQSSFTEPFG